MQVRVGAYGERLRSRIIPPLSVGQLWLESCATEVEFHVGYFTKARNICKNIVTHQETRKMGRKAL